jgi:hypothetical protein
MNVRLNDNGAMQTKDVNVAWSQRCEYFNRDSYFGYQINILHEAPEQILEHIFGSNNS